MIDYLKLMLLELAPTEDEGGGAEEAKTETQTDEDGTSTFDESEDDASEGDEDEPQTYDLDGETLTLEELREMKKGYLRQSDYTKKTQQAAKERQENKDAIELYNFIRSNPELATKLNELAQETGTKAPAVKNPEMENLQVEFYGMKLDTQLNAIKAKDPDADEVAILTICADEGCDADKAYAIWRGQNFDKILEKKLSQNSSDITKNIKKNGIQTKTMINGKQIKNDTSSGLSQAELKMAEKLQMSPAEYAKWK